MTNEIIENEFYHELNNNFQEMNETVKKEHDKLTNNIINLINQIGLALPKESKHLIFDLENDMMNQLCIENKYYFKRGITLAFTNLSFIKKLILEGDYHGKL